MAFRCNEDTCVYRIIRHTKNLLVDQELSSICCCLLRQHHSAPATCPSSTEVHRIAHHNSLETDWRPDCSKHYSCIVNMLDDNNDYGEEASLSLRTVITVSVLYIQHLR